MRSKNDHQIYH